MQRAEHQGPVSAVSIAIATVSRSRISPTSARCTTTPARQGRAAAPDCARIRYRAGRRDARSGNRAIAIETAETGHLVFGTLHTSTAASTVDRVIDQFPSDRQAQIRVMLSGVAEGVISQRCARRSAAGAAALEVLIVTSAISNLIRESKTFQVQSMMQVGKNVGMVTLNDALMDLVTKKIVAPRRPT